MLAGARLMYRDGEWGCGRVGSAAKKKLGQYEWGPANAPISGLRITVREARAQELVYDAVHLGVVSGPLQTLRDLEMNRKLCPLVPRPVSHPKFILALEVIEAALRDFNFMAAQPDAIFNLLP